MLVKDNAYLMNNIDESLGCIDKLERMLDDYEDKQYFEDEGDYALAASKRS